MSVSAQLGTKMPRFEVENNLRYMKPKNTPEESGGYYSLLAGDGAESGHP
jgi:hypothetical protein